MNDLSMRSLPPSISLKAQHIRGPRFLLTGLLMILMGGSACDETDRSNSSASIITEVTDLAPPPQCEPDCAGRVCGVDPRCGTSCGTCRADQVCEAAQCITPEEYDPLVTGGETAETWPPSAGETSSPECSPTCESAAAQCGELCGMSCGVCETNERCDDHQCVCVPQCAGKSCGDPDGCDGQCAPCPRSESCQDCALRLRVLSLGEVDGQVSSARVALSLHMPEGAPHPKVADLHLTLTGSAVLGRVGLGETLLTARKQLIPDPATGLPYRVQESTYSLMVLSTQNTDEIPNGDWLILDLQLGNTDSAPVQLSIMEREQTFAPPGADLQLWNTSLGEGLVIWPALNQGE